jgi:transcriptional regulator with XRE-family HTH domain
MAGSKRFGTFLHARRKRCGLTLEVLAKACRSSKGYLSGIENGKVAPPRNGIVRMLAKALDLHEGVLRRVAVLEKLPPEVREIGNIESVITAGYRALEDGQ